MIKKEYINYLSKIIILALVYYVAGKLSFMMSHSNNIVTIVIFAAEGFALAAVILFGKSIWPGIFLGQLLLALSSGLALSPSFLISVINSMEAVLGAILFQRYLLDKELTHIKDIYGLFLLIVFVLQVFSSVLGNFVLLGSSIITWEEYPLSLFSWWFGNAIGQTLFTPALLIFFVHYQKFKLSRIFLIILFFSSLNFMIFYVFKIENSSLILSITIPILLLLTIFMGVSEAMIGVFGLIINCYLFYTHKSGSILFFR